LALIAKLVESMGRKQASASFLKKRSKKLLSDAPSGNVTISRRARARPIGSRDRTTVGVARSGDGLRRKECSGYDESRKFFWATFFQKKGLLASFLDPRPGNAPATRFGIRAKNSYS
jgi:hypothetical protein